MACYFQSFKIGISDDDNLSSLKLVSSETSTEKLKTLKESWILFGLDSRITKASIAYNDTMFSSFQLTFHPKRALNLKTLKDVLPHNFRERNLIYIVQLTRFQARPMLTCYYHILLQRIVKSEVYILFI